MVRFGSQYLYLLSQCMISAFALPYVIHDPLTPDNHITQNCAERSLDEGDAACQEQGAQPDAPVFHQAERLGADKRQGDQGADGKA